VPIRRVPSGIIAIGESGREPYRENTTRGEIRPTTVLTCYFKRQRIGAYLDGALDASQDQSLAAHLERCGTCRAEADSLRRIKLMVSRSARVTEPDWTGFWQGIVRGVERARQAPAPVPADRVAWRPRLALAGAMVAGLLALTLWQAVEPPLVSELGSFVQTAQTEYPDGSVMVYSPAEGDMTVIWVLGTDRSGSGSL
jgi:anti-sigma factor RsiW